MGIKSWTEQIFTPKAESKQFTFQKYINELETGLYRNKFVFGVSEEKNSLLSVDMKNSPNALFVGAMGSGKSKAAVFSLYTWMYSNSDQTVLFVVDPLKGAGDYATLLEKDSKGKPLYRQVYEILSSEQGIIRLIDMLYDEAMARRSKFNEVQAESFIDYERKTGKKVARVITLMEEFHAIPYAIMNFYPDFKVDLTTANKFHTLMRVGRSYGIWFVACTQKSTKSDIPTEMTPNFVNKNVFRVSAGESNYILGSPDAAYIKQDQKGRCLTEYGPTQFPIFGDKDDNGKTEKALLKKYVKPLDAECFYLTNDIILDVLSGKDTKDQLKHKKITELVKSIESNNAELVITLLHEKQGHKVEQVDSKLDVFGISHIIHWNSDVKAAVLTRCSAKGKKITGKHISQLKKAMDYNECTHGIIYTSSTDLPSSLYKAVKDLNIEVVDYDDMYRAAYKVEKEGEKANLLPDKLADDSKENGSYQESHNIQDSEDDYSSAEFSDDDFDDDFRKKQFSDKKENFIRDEIIDLEKLEEEKEEIKEEELDDKLKAVKELLIDEEIIVDSKKGKTIENQQPIPFSNKVKKEKVNKLCTIRREDTPSLLFHVMRTESDNEVYRVLFFILDNLQVKHKFYIDKKITKSFSFKEKQILGVNSIEEWNNQKDTFSDEDFDREFLSFLENFKPCVFPVHSICWKEDESVLKKYLSQCGYMAKSPAIIEKHTSVYFNNTETRQELITKMRIKSKKVSLFNPIEIDLEIWKNIN